MTKCNKRIKDEKRDFPQKSDTYTPHPLTSKGAHKRNYATNTADYKNETTNIATHEQ
jgi:hypothetical protein